MKRDLFSGEELPEFIFAPRTDPIYNAHGYLTKVPVDGILPHLAAFSAPGEIIVDMFAGSGMTAVAAKIGGRNAIVSDISVLGHHIGEGYLLDAKATEISAVGSKVIQRARGRFQDLYETTALRGHSAEVIRTIWSFVYKCKECKKKITYFEALKECNWKAPTKCIHCRKPFSKRSSVYVGDVPVLVVVTGEDGRQTELPVTESDKRRINRAESHPDQAKVPNRVIEPHREMYRRSALGKWNLNETKRFFSGRNALALFYLWDELNALDNGPVKKKLLFAFTAILPRASRRYQWSAQRPLNAATQTYYIAPVYYEWNVFELYERKVRASIKADEEIRARVLASGVTNRSTQKYVLSSAAKLSHLRDQSVDYVFTDPPFGSNLFYADMSLFHETWLQQITNDSDEAVIHTNGEKAEGAGNRYEGLLRAACEEAFRVLKPGRYLSLVFGNSSGKIWSMVQRILLEVGFEPRPAHVAILDKGQRSVKGLTSGFEGVSTLDLILTVKKPVSTVARRSLSSKIAVEELIKGVLAEIDFENHQTPSHVYLAVLKEAFERQAPVAELHLSQILEVLRKRGISVDTKSGEFTPTGKNESHSSRSITAHLP